MGNAEVEIRTNKQKPRRRTVLHIYKDISQSAYTILSLGSFVGIIALWYALCLLEIVDPIFLPTPHRVLLELLYQLSTSAYWEHIGISVFRVSSGFLLACVIAIPIGIFAGTFKVGEAFIEPPTEFIRYMPAVAFIPLIMVWAGIGESAKILLIFIGTFFQLVLMVAAITRQVSVDLLQAAFTLGASRWQAIETVLIPAIKPNLMNTLRMTLGWAWTYLVVAELVAVNSGLGYAIMKAQRYLNTEQIFVGIIVIGLLGLLSDRIFAYCNRRFFPWV